jgi:hypothetical protein
MTTVQTASFTNRETVTTGTTTSTGTALETQLQTQTYTATSTNPADDYRGAEYAVFLGTQSQVTGNINTPGITGAADDSAGVALYEVELANVSEVEVEVEVEIEVEAEAIYGTEQIANTVDVQEEVTSTSVVTATSTTPNPTGGS